ncbi:MAG: PPC domain-containing protein [Tunicatimonas sp.]
MIHHTFSITTRNAVVSANGSEGESISLSYSATANGTYYLRIRESSGRTSSEPFTVTYNLDTSDEYECNDTPALADANEPLVPGQEYEAYIRTGSDNDWFAFEMDSVGIVTVKLQTPSDIDQIYVNVFENANDNILVDYTEVEGGETLDVVAGPLSAGTHYLRFNSWTNDWQRVGEQSRNPYKFTLTLEYEEDEINNTFAQATDVTEIIDQGVKEGRIYPRNLRGYQYEIDVDYYKFTVQDTTTLRISVTALNTDSYTFLQLYNQPNDNSGSIIGRFDGNNFGNRQKTISREYTFVPGEYYIKVENNETSAEPYDLKIETVQ